MLEPVPLRLRQTRLPSARSFRATGHRPEVRVRDSFSAPINLRNQACALDCIERKRRGPRIGLQDYAAVAYAAQRSREIPAVVQHRAQANLRVFAGKAV